ncbi:Predicted arabinose efflux permease, MFS family [Pedobacter westerhofensis]|uniref:Predicted arabinose efflux permease, MFS family n=1 Tax=Pedobacter westerhofensis TaxID=425512 RepID=A0A521FU10_9SPHI|nr:MFS transporter [Pedobacter westerhofensis]SMO99021.1 Predicted arabinose efflux permease, MFS family [Pedobacter westerhofensis]
MSVANPNKSIPLTNCLLVIFAIIFSEFLIMGISLGTLPEFVHRTLGYNNIIVGAVIGLQYVATLLTRHLAGQSADAKGGRITVSIGLGLSALSGIFCLISLWFHSQAFFSLILLCLGRVLLGIGESYLVIGIFAWGFLLVGSKNTGKVMVWNGLGMHGGMALGAPLGIYLQTKFGLGFSFAGIALLPFVSFLVTNILPNIPLPQLEKRLPFYKAVKLVWGAGTGLALASIGFSGIASFITLYFLQRGWANASLAISAFGAGYIVMRLFFAHYPDKFGGARVAIVCLAIEAIGQLLIWQAPGGIFAIAGAVLTGCGMSLVFPSFGQLAIKHVSQANRGMAMAAYNAFFDLGMGLTAPIAGVIAGGTHYENIYLMGGIAALIGLALASRDYYVDKSASLSINA